MLFGSKPTFGRYCYLHRKPFTPANNPGYVLGERVPDPSPAPKPLGSEIVARTACGLNRRLGCQNLWPGGIAARCFWSHGLSLSPCRCTQHEGSSFVTHRWAPRPARNFFQQSLSIVAEHNTAYRMGINNNKKEMPMTDTLTIGKRLVPLEHVALIEPFDPSSQTRIQSERPFQARIVLIDRESVLTEEAPAALAERHGFRILSEDGIATNPAVHFSVEAFEAAEGFEPKKPYRSRLLWRDQDGQSQSKLLLAEPAHVLAIAVRGEKGPSASPTPAESASRRGRRRKPSPNPA